MSDQIHTLSDLCIQAYQQLLSITETRLQNIIGTNTVNTPLQSFICSCNIQTFLVFPLVPTLLESEAITSLSGSAGKLPVSRRRAGSDPRKAVGEAPSMGTLLRELGALHTAMSRQALSSELLEQAFHQLTYLISTSAFNSLLLRKDMCSWSRGMQIR